MRSEFRDLTSRNDRDIIFIFDFNDDWTFKKKKSDFVLILRNEPEF